MEKLLSIMKKIMPDIDYETCDDLIDSEAYTSLEVVELISEIEEEFDITILPDELKAENFNSMKSIWKLIESKK